MSTMTEEDLKEIQQLRDEISEDLSEILYEFEKADTESIFIYSTSLKEEIQRLQEI